MEKKETYLYVLLLPHMDKDYNLSYKVKFGFTENFDDRMKKGYSAYYGEEGYQILHVYKGDFTREVDETIIKQYLKKYSLFGNEWFKCCQEVLGFFNTYDTPEKLKKRVRELPFKTPSGSYYRVNIALLKFIEEKLINKNDFLYRVQQEGKLIKTLREYNYEDQFKYIINTYQVNEIELRAYIKEFENLYTSIDRAIIKLAVEFNELGDSNKKLSMLVGLEDLEGITEKDINAFLELIHPKYKEYYTVMGPKFIKQFSCKEAEIKREWAKLKSNDGIKDKIDSEIYKTFEIGKRYAKSGIKDTLNKLYERLNYGKRAKSTDIDLYFEVKAVKFQDSTGKWVNGVEILEKL